MRARLLVVDDEPASAEQIRQMLGEGLAEVSALAAGEDAVTAVVDAERRGHGFDVVLLDYFMPRMGGVDVLRQMNLQHVDSRVIIMSGRDPGEVAVAAMRLGAFDFISKPLSRSELRLRVERALRDRQAADGGKEEPGEGSKRRPRKSDVIIGGAGWIKDLYERISMVAATDVTVAIYGESGTGKELVARTIHNLSRRYESSFVVVNCAAIPESLLEDELFGHVKGAFTDATKDREGLFSAADGGTLFLDEIGEMPLSLQVKILRVLQSQEFRRIGDDSDTRVDVRVITATNRELEQAVKAGVFRQDLYYRINVFPMALPPLRDRREDIALLAHHFLLKHRTKVGKQIDGFTPAALAKLSTYDFPGNVRELENKVHHALVLAQGESIEPHDIQLGGGLSAPVLGFDLSRPFRELKREMVEAFESEYVRSLLRAHHGNLAAASRQAGMDRKNLWAFARKYRINLKHLRDEKS
ncbi:MAG TPA: sigma-54 dependent transcriptional regulator [Kofleriaceae bacterium]|nr:sigma-54 dependent transcriptional regulator [Kofleriaceae bacterium]